MGYSNSGEICTPRIMDYLSIIMQLTDIKLKALKAKEKNYRVTDGEGLAVVVKKNGKKYFVYRYYFCKKGKEIHLGAYPDLSLKNARLERNKHKAILSTGADPALEKKKELITQHVNNSIIFRDVAIDWLEFKRASWSPDYWDAVESRMKRIVFPKIGSSPLHTLEPAFLYSVITKIQTDFTVGLAHKCKQYIGLVFAYAIPLDKATRNPVNDLTGLLKPNKKTHYPAITDPLELGRFLKAVDHYNGSMIVISALKLSVQLFCRPGELRQLEWSFINWDQNRIEIPARIMKMDTDHIIPLTRQSTLILKEMHEITGWQDNAHYVFPSQRGFSRPLSENGVRIAIRSMGYTKEQLVPHGFRATARTLLDEVLHYPIEIIEQQLAHTVKDVNGRAYNRTKHLKQRAEMMQAWADYLNGLQDTDKLQ
ncbi:MAG: hypothetical protein OFPI_00380 [Osedax symbiont Rs2]|nr:MAG: hypothetical protein OFPI_00380 [Osedax symbiont Rs2]